MASTGQQLDSSRFKARKLESRKKAEERSKKNKMVKEGVAIILTPKHSSVSASSPLDLCAIPLKVITSF